MQLLQHRYEGALPLTLPLQGSHASHSSTPSCLALTASSPQWDLPDGCHLRSGVRLLPHQRALLSRCLDMEQHCDLPIPAPTCQPQHIATRIGVLGDMQGSGKSLVILALLAFHTTLLVTTPPLLEQWKMCASEHAPVGVEYRCVTSSRDVG